MNERDEVLYEFAVASDGPDEDTIAKFIAKYPQYEQDIRSLATSLQSMHDMEESTEPISEAELKEAEHDTARFMITYFEALYKHSGRKIGNA